MVLPKASVKASIFLLVVNVLENRIIVNTMVIKFHFNVAFNDGRGFLTRHTYQPFRTTILPYWYWLGLPEGW
jgi:hypothetical protein